MPKALLSRWKRLAHRAAQIQSHAVLSLLYWVVVVPLGALRRRRPAADAQWLTRQSRAAVTVEDARRQF